MSWGLLPLVALLLAAAPARAELWGYVDGQGVAHVASKPLNSRYGLVLGSDATPAAAQGRVPGKTDGSQGLLTWLEFAPEVKAVQPYLREAAAAHGVDTELLKAIIAVESGYQRDAVSRAGAVGLMQILPEAAGSSPERLLDARHNVQTGARLLARLIKRFGRIDVALAAWNAGEGTVRRHGGQMPPIPETQAHVHMVLELYWALLQRSLPAQAQHLRIHSS
ncbi:lytic transglycosylase domain-containing protein [Roseateles sp. DAIF2]|uniref:lytic transglycosylase domain-containing protein n=1 Tax=Roseateles sp. DAIF2 TaxID=2714952 RepID=UPI0018A2D903|nr:lytic transglycosylase domain-containing protein [Roseateles sp. DAIF2]QPF74408.1 lytic transglycosylase domain-containing protein [Roseateles sp. DAIF2]